MVSAVWMLMLGGRGYATAGLQLSTVTQTTSTDITGLILKIPTNAEGLSITINRLCLHYQEVNGGQSFSAVVVDALRQTYSPSLYMAPPVL